jgi:diguanylate cyclase (GGDEF)-like protein
VNDNNNAASKDFAVAWWNRVSLRIGFGVLVVTTVALAVIGWLFDSHEETLFREQHTANAHAIATIIVDKLADRMMAGGGATTWATVAQEAEQMRETAGVARIVLVSNAGLVKMSTDPAYAGTHLELRDGVSDAAASTVVDSTGGPELRVITAIRARLGCLRCHTARDADGNPPPRGFLTVDFALAPLAATERHRRNDILTIGAVSGVALLVVIFWLFEHYVMRGIAAIGSAAGRLARGDLGARVVVAGGDELSQLGGRFNQMAQRIEGQVARLEASNLESSLLYELVIEVARNIEITDVATTIVTVLTRNLHPQRLVFLAKSPDGQWICARGPDEPLSRCEDGLSGAPDTWPETLTQVLQGLDLALVAGAARSATIQFGEEDGAAEFAMPLVSEGELIGLLACRPGPRRVAIQRELIGNLAAHLTLAVENALHYTGAVTDALTQLRNKGYGLARLDEAVYAAQRQDAGLALAMLDIDFFKRVNDTYGHPVGDEVLRETAQRISRCVRKADVAVRYGGEEFMVILPNTHPEKAEEVGERLRAAVAARPVLVTDRQLSLNVTVSVGVALYRRGGDDAASLIERADKALYRAKGGGRNRVEISSGMDA